MQVLLSTLREHLSGRLPPVPDEGRLLWHWFVALCRTRTSHGYGPNPISYTEIEAYARLYRWPLEPRHVDMILAMDRVWMEHARSAAGVAPVAASRPGVEMTPDAFDAVFG